MIIIQKPQLTNKMLWPGKPKFIFILWENMEMKMHAILITREKDLVTVDTMCFPWL